jgi:hypothetical protein
MAHLLVANGGENLQICRITVDVLNKQSWTPGDVSNVVLQLGVWVRG